MAGGAPPARRRLLAVPSVARRPAEVSQVPTRGPLRLLQKEAGRPSLEKAADLSHSSGVDGR